MFFVFMPCKHFPLIKFTLSIFFKLRNHKTIAGAMSLSVQILKISLFLLTNKCLLKLYSASIFPDYLSDVMGTKTDDVLF